MRRGLIPLAIAALGASGCTPERELVDSAGAIHDAVITIDSHVDIPMDFATAAVDPLTADAQVNLMRMVEDGLDAAFFIVFDDGMAAINAQWPPSNVEDFMDHIEYAVDLIGIDHVGISSYFGGGGGIVGWNNASETFNVTMELVRRGYTEESIEKLWGGNLLRVLREVERVAASAAR